MSDMLKKLMASNGILDHVSERLESLDKMLTKHDDMTKIVPKFAGFVYDQNVELATIFQNENVTVSYGIWRKLDAVYPIHSHKESDEYLIVISGSFEIVINGKKTILMRGQGTFVPMGQEHLVTALEANSEMFGICMPPEKAYLRE